MNLQQKTDKDLHTPDIKKGTYRHYKGGLYEIVGVSLDTETLRPFVVYKSKDNSGVEYWTRPYEMFFETVELEYKTVPRFEYLGDRP